MLGLDAWDWALLAVAGYVAILSLVRLMRTHRDIVLRQWQERIQQEAQRRPRRQRTDLSGADAPRAADRARKTDAA